MESPNVKIVLGEPAVVSQAPPNVRKWGPWQFPVIERLADGRIHVSYHIENDDAAAYGKPVGHAYSKDDGKTWEISKDYEGVGGLLLANGDRLRCSLQPSIPVEQLRLPKPLYTYRWTYGFDAHLYSLEQLPAELQKGWRLLRLPRGAQKWVEEFPAVQIRDARYYDLQGRFAFMSFTNWGHWHAAPDGAVMAMFFHFRPMPESLRARLGDHRIGAVLLRSADHGRTWNMWGDIPYQPDEQGDPLWAKRDGFQEPDFCWLPDRSMFCLLRTEDGNSPPGRLYAARSRNGGRTWSKPYIFDDRGVWPQLLVLKNGVTLASYGRPGLFIRASADPAGEQWDAHVEIVKPRKDKLEGTCAYSGLLALDENTALLVYSDFNWPDENGVNRKTILARTVTAQRVGDDALK